jgi:hypothetical protein
MEAIIKKMKRDDFIRILDQYYSEQNRDKDHRPKYETYSLKELKQSIRMFGIQLKIE